MYERFDLPSTAEHIEGYHWRTDNPKYVVCLVHGIGEHAGRYQRVADSFNPAGIAMVGMDTRGHGRSSGKRGHTAPRLEVLADIDNLITYAEEKYPGVPLVLYGHSMGGNFVLDYHARGKLNGKPCAYLVSAPWVKLSKPISGALYSFVKVMSKIAPTFAISSSIDPAALGNLDVIKNDLNPELVHDKITVLTAVDGFEVGNALYDGLWKENGGAEGKPFLLMHGSADMICSVEGSRKLAKDNPEKIQYIEWEGLYHEIHNGSPTSDGSQVIEKMVEWISAL